MLLDQLGNQGLKEIVIFVFITSFRCFDLNQKLIGRPWSWSTLFGGKQQMSNLKRKKIPHIICDKDTNVSAGFKL